MKSHYSKMFPTIFRRLISIAFVTAVMAANSTMSFSGKAFASEPFPSKPITIIVTSAVGSATDQLARGVAQFWSEVLGVAVLVDNRPGGEHLTGFSKFIRSDADGYTLSMFPGNTLVNHAYQGNLKVQLGDVEWLAVVHAMPQATYAASTGPIKSFNDLIKMKRVQYGEKGYTSTGVPYVVSTLQAFNVPFTFIPGYQTPELPVALMRGEFDVFSRTLSFAKKSGMLHEELVPIMVAGSSRNDLAPDTPTLAEIAVQYGKPQLSDVGELGVLSTVMATPPETRKAVKEELARTLTQVFNDKRFKTFAEKQGWSPGYVDPDKTRKTLLATLATNKKLNIKQLIESLR